MYVGSGGIAPPLRTSSSDGGEWSASHPCQFISRKEVRGSHWIEGWMGPRAGVDSMKKRKSVASAGNHPFRGLVSVSTELSRFPFLCMEDYFMNVFFIESVLHSVCISYNSS
jgi:hypothetical protein